MGVLTNLLKLLKPGENDYYNQQTEQADNWDKVDNYAVLTNTDKNAIWGGLDGGGLIEDPSVTKVVGKRYIGADGKAYICLVPSNINNSTNYTPCNVVDNLDKLNALYSKSILTDTYSEWIDFGSWGVTMTLKRYKKSGVTTKEEVIIIKERSLVFIPAGTHDFSIPTNQAFPAKFWGEPTSIGTDDPVLAFNTSSVVGSPSIIRANFSKDVPVDMSCIIKFTWIYNS